MPPTPRITAVAHQENIRPRHKRGGTLFLGLYRLIHRFRDKTFSLAAARSFGVYGKRSVIQPPVRISGEQRIAIGDDVFIGSGSWLQVLEGSGDGIAVVIGSGTSMAGGCVVSASRSIRLGRKVLMARNVYIADHQHAFERIGDPIVEQGIAHIGPVEIGDGAWLGQNVVVGPSVRIGRGAVIGANSVVLSDVDDYTVAVGAPARPVRSLLADKPLSGVPRPLVLSYHFPPIGGAGAQRPARFVRYLHDLGHEPVVVTGPGEAIGRWTPRDATLEGEIPGTVEVIRTEGEPGEVSKWRRRAERWLGIDTNWNRWWVRESVARGLEVEDVDLVYAFMSPYATADAACRLARVLRKPWIADLGDPWALDEMAVYPSALHRRREIRRMGRLLGSAAAVVTTTPEAARRILETFPQLIDRPVVPIACGFDRDDFVEPEPARDDGVFRIVHTGYLHTDLGLRQARKEMMRRLLGAGRNVDILTRSHVYLLKAVEQVIRVRPELAQKIEVHLAGLTSDADREVAGGYEFVRMAGYVSHADAVSLMRSADLLFLPLQDLAPDMRSATIPGKTYEYLASRRPILAAVPQGDARDLLLRSGAALVVGPDDVDGMAEAIVRVLDGTASLSMADRNFLKDFEYRELTGRVSELISYLASFSDTSLRRASTRRRAARAVEPAPRTSVVIPAYNAARWIGDTLASVLSQTYDDFEIIVVDDASNDDTAEIVAAIDDRRLHFHRNQRNIGQAANYNLAVRLSRGQYVKPLPADDLLRSDCIERMAELLDTEPSVGMVFSRRDFLVDEPTRGAAKWQRRYEHMYRRFGELNRVNDGRSLFERYLAQSFDDNWIGEPANVMLRRTAWDRAGGFRSGIRQAPDMALWIHAMFYFDVGFIDEALATYRITTSSITAKTRRDGSRWLDRMWLLESLLADENMTEAYPELTRLARGERARLVLRGARQLTRPRSYRARVREARALIARGNGPRDGM